MLAFALSAYTGDSSRCQSDSPRIGCQRRLNSPFDTSVLDRALAEQAARWERERAALLQLLQQLLLECAERYGLRSAYIFGSIVSPGRFSERSDVDVAVVEMPVSSFFPLAAFLSERLGRDVDLIWLDEVHFAATIKRTGLLWTKSG